MALALSIIALVITVFIFGFMAALTIGEIRHLNGKQVLTIHPALLIVSGISPIISLVIVLGQLPIN